MPSENQIQIELAADLTAHRAAYRFLLEALRASLARFDKTAGPLLLEAMELKLSHVKGELLYCAPADLPAELKPIANTAFHRTFDSLSAEIIASAKEAFDEKE